FGRTILNVRKIGTSPITGVHFWFDRPVMDELFLTLIDTHTQWIVNKTALYSTEGGGSSPARHSPLATRHYPNSSSGQQSPQLDISAPYAPPQKPPQEIMPPCPAEVRQPLPRPRQAQLVKATVIKEAAATFSPHPGVDFLRPKQETQI